MNVQTSAWWRRWARCGERTTVSLATRSADLPRCTFELTGWAFFLWHPVYTSLRRRSLARRVLLVLARVYDHLALGGVAPPAGEAGWVEQRDRAAAGYLEGEGK